MTKQYLGSHKWYLVFNNGKKITLTENQIKEIVEQYEEMLYENEQGELHGHIHDEQRKQ